MFAIQVSPYLLFYISRVVVALDLSPSSPLHTYNGPDSYVLSELPLSALLKVKKSVSEIICSGHWKDNNSCPAPLNTSAVPSSEGNLKLREVFDSNEPPSPRTLSHIQNLFAAKQTTAPFEGWHDNRKTYQEMWKGPEESGKIQKLFQFSITALAFLAFGGYLLCMIVQAIKSKGSVYYHPNASSVYAAAVKKKKPIFSYGKRRKRRSAQTVWSDTDEYPSNKSTDLDLMYDGLISAITNYMTVAHSPA